MIILEITNSINEALQKLKIEDHKFVVDKTKNIKFGDFYSNVAMTLSKTLKKPPQQIAQMIVDNLNKDNFQDISIQNPGFINFKIKPHIYQKLISDIYQQKSKYGYFDKKNITYNLEYVSANPTGYLHIAHAANAIYGDILANTLEVYGYNVNTEYYINDAGNQIDKLASSTLIRYLQLFNINIDLQADAYHGSEIKTLAQHLKDKYNDDFINVRVDENFNINDLKVNQIIKEFAVNFMLDEIKKDLASMRTQIKTYTSELFIRNSGMIEQSLDKLKEHIYMQDGAKWLRTTTFGDDKDRVLYKTDGSMTYFTPDIAYHNYKFSNQKVDKLINIWGTDHLGYIPRMKAAVQCLGYDPNDLIVICAQVMKLTKNNQEFKLSKRSGQSLTIKELVDMIGVDAIRWFLGSSSMSSHVIIDVDLVLAKNNNNPLYYVQYAHARANQVLNKQVYEHDFQCDLLVQDQEKELLNQLEFYKVTIANAANNFEPHRISNYLYDLASLFHNYYANFKINDESNIRLSQQRYTLVWCVKQILNNGLLLMKIEPYDKMFN